MNNVTTLSIIIFFTAIIMAMTGRGGGNFYVPLLILFGITAHTAAAHAQLILVGSAAAAMLVFQKDKLVDWKLALVLDPPTDIMAFVGGYYAHYLPETTLKLIFAGLLFMTAYFMFQPVKPQKPLIGKRFGFWQRTYRNERYVINLWTVLPLSALTGFAAGMVGIAGGSFKVPLMVLACGVPMRIAVGTSSVMVALTALMGFLGHTTGGDFKSAFILPLVMAAIIGGLLGGKLTHKIKPEKLKQIFAVTTLIAALFMLYNALTSL